MPTAYDPIAGIRGEQGRDPVDHAALAKVRDTGQRRTALPLNAPQAPARPAASPQGIPFRGGQLLPRSAMQPPTRALPDLDGDYIRPAPDTIRPLLEQAEELTGVPAPILEGVGYNESRWRPDVISGQLRSPKGAAGMMQLMPSALAEIKRISGQDIDPLDPEQAVMGAATYLKHLYGQFDGNWVAALAAYNWGQGNVRKAQRQHGDNWTERLPAETRQYVERMMPVVELLDPTPSATLASANPSMFIAQLARQQEAERPRGNQRGPDTRLPGATLLDFTKPGGGRPAGAQLLFDPSTGEEQTGVGGTGRGALLGLDDEGFTVPGRHPTGGYMTLFNIGGQALFKNVLGTVNLLSRQMGWGDIGRESMDALAEDIRRLEETLPQQMMERRAAQWAKMGEGSVWADPGAILVQLVENLPNFMATLGSGVTVGIAGKVLGWSPKLITATAALAGGSTEGAIVTGVVFNDLSEGIRESTDEGLMVTPRYRELRDSGLSEEDAKEALIDEIGPGKALPAGGISAFLGSVATGYIGNLIGAGRHARLMRAPRDVRAAIIAKTAPGAARQQALQAARVMGHPGRAVTALKGAAVEASTESMQEAQEQVFSNLAAQQSYDPTRGTFQDVGEAAASGAGLGGIMGAGPAALAGKRAAPPPSPPPAAPPASPPRPSPTGPALPPNFNRPTVQRRGAGQTPPPAAPPGAVTGEVDYDRPTVQRRAAMSAAAKPAAAPAAPAVTPPAAAPTAAPVTAPEQAAETVPAREKLDTKGVKAALTKLNPLKTGNGVAVAVRSLAKRLAEIHPDATLPAAQRQRSPQALTKLLQAIEETLGDRYPGLKQEIEQAVQAKSAGEAVNALADIGDRVFADKVRQEAGATREVTTDPAAQLTQAEAVYDAEVENLRRRRRPGKRDSVAKRAKAGERAVAMEGLATALENAVNKLAETTDFPGIDKVRQLTREVRKASEQAMSAGKKATGKGQTQKTPIAVSHRRQDVREAALKKIAVEIKKGLKGEAFSVEGIREAAEAALTKQIVASIKKRRAKAATEGETKTETKTEEKAEPKTKVKTKGEAIKEKAKAKAEAKKVQPKADEKPAEETQPAESPVADALREQHKSAEAFISHAKAQPIDAVRGLARNLGLDTKGTRPQIAKRVAGLVWPEMQITPAQEGGLPELVVRPADALGRKAKTVLTEAGFGEDMTAQDVRDMFFPKFNKLEWRALMGFMDAIGQQQAETFRTIWANVVTAGTQSELSNAWLQLAAWMEDIGGKRTPTHIQAIVRDYVGQLRDLAQERAKEEQVLEVEQMMAEDTIEDGTGLDQIEDPKRRQDAADVQLPQETLDAINNMKIPAAQKATLRKLALEQMREDLGVGEDYGMGYSTMYDEFEADQDFASDLGTREVDLEPEGRPIPNRFAGRRIRSRRNVGNWYRSALHRAIETAKMNRGTVEQWMNYLRKTVSQEEIEWSGLTDILVTVPPSKKIDKAALALVVTNKPIVVDTAVSSVEAIIASDLSDRAWSVHRLFEQLTGNVVQNAWADSNHYELESRHYAEEGDAPPRGSPTLSFGKEDLSSPEFRARLREHMLASQELIWDFSTIPADVLNENIEALTSASLELLVEYVALDQYLQNLNDGLRNTQRPRWENTSVEKGGRRYREMLLQLQQHGKPKPIDDIPSWTYRVWEDEVNGGVVVHYRPELLDQGIVDAFPSLQSAIANDGGMWITTGISVPYASVTEAHNELRAIAEHAGVSREDSAQPNPHFDDFYNVLAHVRFNERFDENGDKVMFIEEIQSDWHQQIVREAELGFQNRRYATKDAPFKGQWHKLALKRIMHWAAENGFDRVAWTTGEMQFARQWQHVPVGAKIAGIRYQQDFRTGRDPSYSIKLYTLRSMGEPILLPHLSKRDIRNVLGSEIADLIESGEGFEPHRSGKGFIQWFMTQDSPVIAPNRKGGKFHLYDHAIPNTLAKMLKPFKGEVTPTTIDFAGEKKVVQSVALTPEMQNSILSQGFDLFGGRLDANAEDRKNRRAVRGILTVSQAEAAAKALNGLYRRLTRIAEITDKFNFTGIDSRAKLGMLMEDFESDTGPFPTMNEFLQALVTNLPDNHAAVPLARALLALNLNVPVVPFTRFIKEVPADDGFGVVPVKYYGAFYPDTSAGFNTVYSAERGAIILNMARIPLDRLAVSLLHEAVHAATVQSYYTDNAVRQRIDALYVHMVQAAKSRKGTARTEALSFYGMTDPLEMMSEAMVNPDFQEFLASLPRAKKVAMPQAKNLWQQILGVIKRLLRIEAKDAGFLEQVVAHTTAAFRDAETQRQRIHTTQSKGLGPLMFPGRADVETVASPGAVQAVLDTLKPKSTWEGFVQKLRDGWLWFHTLSQVENRYSRFFDTQDGNNLKKYIAAMREKRSIAHREHASAEQINSRWRQLPPDQDTAVSTTMQEATLWRVDPNLTWDDHTWLHTRETRKELANEQAYNRVSEMYDNLSPEAKRVFTEVTDYFKKQREQIRHAFIDNLIEKFQLPLRWREFLLHMNTIEDVENFMLAPKKLSEKRMSSFWHTVGEEYRERFQTDAGKNLGLIVKDLRQIIQASGVDGVYVPLRRYGDNVITVQAEQNANFATQEEATDFANDLQQRSPANKIVDIRRMNDGQWTVDYIVRHIEMDADLGRARERAEELKAMGYENVQLSRKQDAEYQNMGDLAPLFSDLLRKFKDMPEIEGQLRVAFTEMLASNAMQAAMLKRENYAGVKPREMRQAFAERAYSGGWYLADLLSAEKRRDAMIALREDARDSTMTDEQRLTRGMVVQEISRRENRDLKDRQSSVVSDAIAKTGFLWFLFSPSYSLVNATQPALLTLPYLGGKYGHGKAMREMGRAYKEIIGPFMRSVRETKAGLDYQKTADVFINNILKVYAGDVNVRDALQKNMDRGLMEVTFMQEIADTARGIEGTTFEIAMQMARTLPQGVEVMNRVVTAVATYRLSRQAGASHDTAIESTFDANDQTQLDYSMMNRPPAFKFPGGRAVMLFKMFGQGVYNLLISNMYDAITGAGRPKKEARRILGGLIATHTLTAGILGGIFIEPLRWMINAAMFAFGDDDEPFDLDFAVRDFMVNSIGLSPRAAGIATEGLPNLLNVNAHTRLGIHQLAFMGDFNLSTDATTLRTIGALIGPAASMGLAPIDATRRMVEGDYYGGIKQILPAKVLRDIMQSYEMGMQGLSDRRGVQYASADQFGFGSMAIQAFGFQPTTRTEVATARRQATTYERIKQRRKQVLQQRWHNADTPMARRQVWREEIMPFNRTVPTSDRIKLPSLHRTAAQRRAEERAAGRGQVGGGTMGASRLQPYAIN